MERDETLFPMDTGVAPPFYQIDPNKFQFVCRDVLERQRDAGVVSCGIYGTSGQAQYGIDLIAPLAESEANAVAQCKRYPKITPQEIVDASDEFLEHLSHWENFAVRRFILIVACAMDRRQQQDELQRQRKRFAAHGIEYEWWDARGLRQRLAPHRDIVRLYFPAPSQYWEETICGKEPEPLSFKQSAPSYPFTMSLFESQLEQLSIQFSADVSEEIDSIRELNREGKGEEAYVLINKLRAGKKWDLLPNELKGRILRVTVGLELGQTGDVERARSFLDQAIAYDPDADYSIARALLRYYENNENAEEALKELTAPITVDALNLKLALLVENGSLQKALDLIRQLPADIVPDAGTHHAHALALLGIGDRERAKEAIRTARELKPLWESIRSVEAIINYYESISPAAQPAHHLGWPQAVAWSYLKRDDETLTRLREAESHFAVRAQRSKQPVEHRAYFEIWRLACLANDPERQPSAGEFCRQLLVENPANHRALAWAANRNFGVDFETSVAALERVAAESISTASDDRVESFIVLVALYLGDEKYAAAEKLLGHKQDELKRLGFDDLVALSWGRIYAAKGQLKKALSVSQRTSNSEVRRQLKLTALREKLQLTGKWKPLVRWLEKDYRKTRSSQSLFELCQLKAVHGSWRFVADRAKELIALVGTPDAVRLAAIATSNAGYPARCFDVLESSLHLFPRGKLSNDLLLLKINCQRRLGSLARALLEAEELVAREDTHRNILSLIEVQLQKADLKGLAITARRLLHREDFKTEDILRVAKLVSFEDTELAAKLWRQASAGVLSEPALVGDAISLGYALGLDKELGPLQLLMQDLAEDGTLNIRSLSLTEAVESQKQRARRLTEIFGDYTHGRIMLHRFADESQAAVVNWLHGFASQNRTSDDLRHRPGIFARHGGRSIKTCAFPLEERRRLHLDVTALLLAAELGILDAVETWYQPIRISEAMPLALVQQLALLSPSQPTQYQININVVEQVEAKRLQIIPQGSELSPETEWGLTEDLGEGWVRIAHQAKTESAYVVDHLPLRSWRDGEQILHLPPSLLAHVINCRSIADALLTHGPLSNARHETALENLGSEASPVLNVVPPAKARLYLMGASADVLAAADLLNLACLHFQVFIPEAVVQLARAGVQEHTHRVEMIEWVQRLLERVRDGIDHRVYEIIPAPDEPEPSEVEKVAHKYDLKTFGDLLRFEVESGDVIWVDDRYVNAYGHRAGAPIVTISDVLQDLLKHQQITQTDYYGKLLQLRRSNIRYLPLDANEVLFHLRSAQLSKGAVVETEELAVLRRYIAACLLDSENLQKSPQPPGSPNAFGEINFVYETITGVVDALTELWSDETLPPEDAEIRAEWLLTNLYTGRFGCVHLLPEAVKYRGDELHLVGVDIAELFAKGIAVGERQIVTAMSDSPNTTAGEPATEGPSRRQGYFEWLKRRVVAPRVKADPGSMDVASQVIRNIVRASSEREHSPQQQRHIRMLMQQLYLDLPSELQGHIKQDPQLLSWIGIRVAEAIHINGISLPPDEFWQGAEVAINNGEATIEGFSGSVRIKKVTTENLALSSDNSKGPAHSENLARVEADTLELYDESGRLLTKFKHTILGLMSADVSERVRTLNTNGHLFDLDQQTRARQITEIAGAHSPRDRVDRATASSKQSAAGYYLGLEQSLTTTKSFQRDDLTGMTGTGLLQYYRLHHTEAGDRLPFPQALSAAATRLLAEQGVETALDRMASLPVRIADQIVEELRRLETEHQDAILTRFGERHTSPLGKLHLIDLYLRLGDKAEATSCKARSVVQELFDQEIGTQRFKLFKSMLLAINEEFGFWSDAAQWPNDIRLAMVWGHATNWYDLIASTLIPSDREVAELSEWFTSPYRQFCVEMLHYNSGYVRDCAHPAQINRLEFLSLAAPELLAPHGVTALDEIGLLDSIRKVGFDQSDGLLIPATELLGDTALLTNLTGSFLAGDKPCLLGLVGGTEASAFVTTGNLRNIVSLQIEELSANSMDPRHWSFIASVLRGQPVYTELQDDFKSLIHGLNFDLVLSTNREAAIGALMVASGQSSGLGEVERSICENWLMKYIKDFGDRFAYQQFEPDADIKVDLNEELAMILECAVALAVRVNDPRASGMAFSGLIRRMLDSCSGLSDHLHQALQRALFELPVSQLDGMWLVVLTVRASRCID